MSDDSPSTTAGTKEGDRTDRLTRAARDRSFANLRPRDSATLILIDRTESVPKVLLGRRHESHKFLPGKFVFPGGRVEPSDRLMPTAAPLHVRDTERLMLGVQRPSKAKAAGYALAAMRETYEETGLMLGAPAAEVVAPAGPWQAFAQAGNHPGSQRRPFCWPSHYATGAATAFRQPLFRRGYVRGRPPRRRLCRARRRTCRTRLATDHRGTASRYAHYHGGDAGRAAGTYCYRHEPRPSRAVLPHAAQSL